MNVMKELLTDSNQVSFGRSGAFVIITTQLILCFVLSIIKQASIDIPIQWAGLAAMLFGITKAGETTVTVKKPPVGKRMLNVDNSD